MITIGILTVSLVLAMAAPAWAHDCWLQPLGFQVLPYGLLGARLLVGDRMAPEKELSMDRSMTPRLDLHAGGNCIDLLPSLPEDPLPAVECDLDGKEGQALLVMDRDFTTIELTDDQFTGYIDHEHLEDIALFREKNGHRDIEKERYARWVKALVQVGNHAGESLHDRIIGQRLEIVLMNNPHECAVGEALTVQVRFESRPLAGRTVTAYRSSPKGDVSKTTARTDANGLALFRIDGPGIWLIRLVHLCPCGTDAPVDWESHWAAYCFETLV